MEISPTLVNILAILGGAASIVTIVGGLYKLWDIGIKGALEALRTRIARAYWGVPKKTLVILPQHERTLWWHMGGIGGQPAMQIVGDFYFSNITSETMLVPKTYFVAYYQKWRLIPMRQKVEGNIFPRPIVPRKTIDCRVDWWLTPPIKEPGQRLHGRACFIDKFGNEHWTDVLTWQYQ
jgi:hypothetical protein